jgi:hypothetical protein
MPPTVPEFIRHLAMMNRDCPMAASNCIVLAPWLVGCVLQELLQGVIGNHLTGLDNCGQTGAVTRGGKRASNLAAGGP